MHRTKAKFPLSEKHYTALSKAIEYALPAGGKGKPLDMAEASRLFHGVLKELKEELINKEEL